MVSDVIDNGLPVPRVSPGSPHMRLLLMPVFSCQKTVYLVQFSPNCIRSNLIAVILNKKCSPHPIQ